MNCSLSEITSECSHDQDAAIVCRQYERGIYIHTHILLSVCPFVGVIIILYSREHLRQLIFLIKVSGWFQA